MDHSGRPYLCSDAASVQSGELDVRQALKMNTVLDHKILSDWDQETTYGGRLTTHDARLASLEAALII
jgi:hypothetical protein